MLLTMTINSYEAVIDSNYELLSRSIETYNLIDKLTVSWSAKGEMLFVRDGTTHQQRLVRLLGVLRRVSDQDVVDFLRILRADNQEHVANIFDRQNDEIPMTDAHFNSLYQKQDRLSRIIDPYNELILRLMKVGVFSHTDLMRVRHKQNDVEKAGEIVEIVMKKADSAHDRFIAVMNETLHSHVTYVLTGSGEAPLEEEVLQRIEKNKALWVENLYVNDIFLDKLVEQRLLTDAAADRVRGIAKDRDRSEFFLTLMIKKSKNAFGKLADILESTGHRHMALAIFGATAKGKIAAQTSRELSTDEKQKLHNRLVNDINNDTEIKRIKFHDDFSIEAINEGVGKILFHIYTVAGLNNVQKMVQSQELDDLLTDKCVRKYSVEFGLRSLKVSISAIGFNLCRDVLAFNALMTRQHHKLLEWVEEKCIDQIEINNKLLEKLNLPLDLLNDVDRSWLDQNVKASKLLSIISRQPDRVFRQFLDALQVSGQGHIVDVIDRHKGVISADCNGNAISSPVRKNFTYLLSHLDVLNPDVCCRLIQARLLDDNELERLQRKSGRRDSTRCYLLDLKRKRPTAEMEFIKCLRETRGYEHLADKLEGKEDAEMPREKIDEQNRLLQANNEYLVHNLDLSKPALIANLIQNDVLQSSEMETLESKAGNVNKAQHFLMHVLSRDPRRFSRFIKSLQETAGQEFIADHLLHDCRDPVLRTPAPTIIFTDEDLMNEICRSGSIFRKPTSVRREFVESKKLEAYEMRHRVRGHALIINNIRFSLHRSRGEAAESDDVELENLFKSLHFKVIPHRNLSASDIIAEIQKESRFDHKRHDAFVLFIMTHGGEGVVYGTDSKPVLIKEIVQCIGSCPSLQNKPKMMFFQACRKEITKSPKEVKHFDNWEPLGNICAEQNLAQFMDIYELHSTVPGRSSFRDLKKGGTYFVRYFVYVCSTRAHVDDLATMMNTVNRLLLLNPDQSEFLQQIGETIARGVTKKIYFFPNYFLD